MKEISKEVKMKVNGERKVVGVATVKVAETVEEAVELDGPVLLLQKRNAQTLTTEMNDIRANARGGTSKKKLENQAMQRITPDEWQQVAGNLEAIQALIATRVTEIEVENAESLVSA